MRAGLLQCDFIGDRYSYTRVHVNIVLTADFSWSYIAFVGWVYVHTTMGWVCSSVGWVTWVEENRPMSKSDYRAGLQIAR